MSAVPRWTLPLAAAALALAGTGCEKAMQDMYDQPRYDPLEPSRLFPDGASARVPVAGTLPTRQGRLAEASGGRRGERPSAPEAQGTLFPILSAPAEGGQDSPFGLAGPRDIPLALTAETYRRGRERYEIFCTPCHGLLGDGDGMVAQRGFPAPPSFHTDRLRGAPDRHFYAVATQGYGAMYAYADRLNQQDRWAVVAYIRALQLSQHARVQDLAAGDRQRLAAEGDEGG